MEGKILTRIRTVLTAVVFWLGVVGAVIAAVLGVLGTYVDEPLVAVLVGWLAPAATVVTALALIIRRVTEVIPDDRGLLPLTDPVPVNSLEGERRRAA